MDPRRAITILLDAAHRTPLHRVTLTPSIFTCASIEPNVWWRCSLEPDPLDAAADLADYVWSHRDG